MTRTKAGLTSIGNVSVKNVLCDVLLWRVLFIDNACSTVFSTQLKEYKRSCRKVHEYLRQGYSNQLHMSGKVLTICRCWSFTGDVSGLVSFFSAPWHAWHTWKLELSRALHTFSSSANDIKGGPRCSACRGSLLFASNPMSIFKSSFQGWLCEVGGRPSKLSEAALHVWQTIVGCPSRDLSPLSPANGMHKAEWFNKYLIWFAYRFRLILRNCGSWGRYAWKRSDMKCSSRDTGTTRRNKFVKKTRGCETKCGVLGYVDWFVYVLPVLPLWQAIYGNSYLIIIIWARMFCQSNISKFYPF